ncbi:MAG: hypothetical protein WBG50_06020 [Desulfomonilaceae bacterium]
MADTQSPPSVSPNVYGESTPQGGQQAAGENIPAWGTGYGYLPHGMTKKD